MKSYLEYIKEIAYTDPGGQPNANQSNGIQPNGAPNNDANKSNTDDANKLNNTGNSEEKKKKGNIYLVDNSNRPFINSVKAIVTDNIQKIKKAHNITIKKPAPKTQGEEQTTKNPTF